VTQAIEMMSYFRSKSVLQRTSFRGFFEVSQFVKIPVWAFKKTAEMKFPSLAKVSKVAQECKLLDPQVFPYLVIGIQFTVLHLY